MSFIACKDESNPANVSSVSFISVIVTESEAVLPHVDISLRQQCAFSKKKTPILSDGE
jgi:hypothetical protein